MDPRFHVTVLSLLGVVILPKIIKGVLLLEPPIRKHFIKPIGTYEPTSIRNQYNINWNCFPYKEVKYSITGSSHSTDMELGLRGKEMKTTNNQLKRHFKKSQGIYYQIGYGKE